MVVAMQYKISNADAVIFAKKFYEQIGEGKHIDEAVSEARYELATNPPSRGGWNDRAFGTPVVYLQMQSDTPLIAPKRQAAREKGEMLPTKGLCPNPNCSGSIISGRNLCLACGSRLIPCPKCKNTIAEGYGCDNCGYGVTQIPISAKAGVIQPQAKVLEPKPLGVRATYQR